MTIDLSAPNQQFLDSIVSTGIYPSQSDAVNEAVELLRRREELRAEIKIGIELVRVIHGARDYETIFQEQRESQKDS